MSPWGNRFIRCIFFTVLVILISTGWTRGVFARPHVVVFDLASEESPEADGKITAEFKLVALSALHRGIEQYQEWEILSTAERGRLLDPIWTMAPISMEEALELGRETGADWAVQSHLELVGDVFRVSLKLLALSPHLLGIEDDKKAGQTQMLAPRLIDYNSLQTKELLLAEHIVWAANLPNLSQQLERAGVSLLSKGLYKQTAKQEELRRPDDDSKVTVATAEEIAAMSETEEEPDLTERERRAIELSEAARRELDDIQARLDAEHKRRKEEAKVKREVLAEEASIAWAKLEEISGGAGLVTVTTRPALPQPQTYRSRHQDDDLPPPIVLPAPVTWKALQQATSNLTGISREEHLRLLLDFVNTYQSLNAYRPHVEEARNRYTWLNRSRIQWISIRGGSFQLGSSYPIPDERPIQWIEISPFQVSISEVTNAQYKRCVDEGACTPPHWDDGKCEIFKDLSLKQGSLPALMRRGDIPVACVDWQQAQRFATWASGRLLSETEWEFIARSGEKSYIYPWGRSEATCDHAVMTHRGKSGCGFGVPWPVCSKPSGSNNAGLCDLAGNVWEWVADRYRPDHEQVPKDGSPRLGAGRKVIRGGSFASNPSELYASTRGQLEPRRSSNTLGLRVARPIPEP